MTQEAGAATRSIEVNGFVFSAARLATGLNRKAALASARFYKSVAWDFNETLPDHHKLPVFGPDVLKNAA